VSVVFFDPEGVVYVQARPSSLDEARFFAQIELDLPKSGIIRKFTSELNSSAFML
jgi:hypothetical protein